MKPKEARARKLLTTRAVAQASGVLLAIIRNAEGGRYVPSLPATRKLADSLGIEPVEVDEPRASIETAARGRTGRRNAERSSGVKLADTGEPEQVSA